MLFVPSSKACRLLLVLLACALSCLTLVRADIVINEIHYDPDVKTEPVEFIEIHNTGGVAVDLAGYAFTRGVAFVFPAGSTIPAGGYVVVAQDVAAVASKFGVSALGPYTGRLDSDGELLTLRDAGGIRADEVDYGSGFPWPTGCRGGGGSMELIHPSIDNDLGGAWRDSGPAPGPSPGAQNRIYSANIAPRIRQVRHTPDEPASGRDVLVTAKITDPDAVAAVTLSYQLVSPGAYIRLSDAAYGVSWTDTAMHDDGLSGDAAAGDDVFSVLLPATMQTHRRLVRYRIYAADALGDDVTVPYADDEQPNFAYFVYDGVPEWSGANRPGVTPVETFTTETMRSLPVYHLLANATDVDRCQYNGAYENTRFRGTMVYDGVVYDHIEYRVRGEWSTYQSGKNKWKFFFNRSRSFQGRDNWGRKLDVLWDTVNFSGCAVPWMPVHRGMAIDETLAFALYNLAGVPSPYTTFLQFRVVDDAVEANPADQYDGDLWGLYTTIEHPDGRFLDAHGLEDGNTYKIESNSGDKKNQGPTHPLDTSDWNTFRSGISWANTTTWWRNNLNLERYFSFRSINRAVNNSDLRDGWNYYMYHAPDTDLWTIVPWDVDMLWTPVTHWSGVCNIQNSLSHSEFSIGYRNRGREIQDLLLTDEQIGQLVDELAGMVNPASLALTMTDVDQFMWNRHPRTRGGHWDAFHLTPYFHGDFDGQSITRTLSSPDHEGSMGWLKFFLTPPTPPLPWTGTSNLGADNGYDFLDGETADGMIPDTPTIAYTGAAGYPVDGLAFNTNAFGDPQGAGTFGALEWRIGEITDPLSPAFDPAAPGVYEITPVWESGEITPYASDIAVPSDALEVGHTYRARVRMMDDTGRWSHWSAPIQFASGGPDNTTALLDYLRVSELMYDPVGGDAFEFVELVNTSVAAPLDVGGVAFTDGVDFLIPDGVTLASGEHLLVVRGDPGGDFAAFRAHYDLGAGVQIVGPYTGRLRNEGERIQLDAALGGARILAFVYDNARGWPLAPQGGGHSLVPLPAAMDTAQLGSLYYGGNWRRSTFMGGSPGAPDPMVPGGGVLNELMAHTDTGNPPPDDSNDWIELHNPTAAPITLDDHFLSDDVTDPTKWAIPPGTQIGAGGFLDFDEENDFHVVGGFGLSKSGEQLILSHLPGDGTDRIVDCVRFKGQENGVSLGRSADGEAFWFAETPTRGAPNAAPTADLVVSELMYHPTDDALAHEFIELQNPTNQAVALENAEGPWRIGGGVAFTFPPGASIAAGGVALVVAFDPNNAAALADFEAYYAIASAGDVFGPYAGALSNRVARVAVERPQAPDPPDLTGSWVIVDEVIYFEQEPFPIEPDGGGLSLNRVSPNRAGREPANWTANTPSPGAVDTPAEAGSPWMLY